MKIKAIVVIVILVIIFGGIYGWHWFVSKKVQAYFAHMSAPPVFVNVETTKAEEWHTLIAATGTVNAQEGVNVTPEVSGKIVKILFRSGQSVQQGDLLIELNPQVLLATLASRQAQLTLTKTSYQRQQQLFAEHASPASNLDEARAQYEQALANLDQTQAELAQTAVRAPFSGVLGLRQVNLGQYVQAGDVIVNLQTVDPMQVNFSIPENAMANVTQGLSINVSSLAHPERVLQGKIVALDSELVATSRTIHVRALVDNKERLLTPGMFVSVEVVLPLMEHVVSVPQIAVTYSTAGDFVYVIKDNKAIKTYVTLGDRRGDRVAVTKGLAGGENVVFAGQNKLRDGAVVEIIAPEDTHQPSKT